MKFLIFLPLLMLFALTGCKPEPAKAPDAQTVVDSAIARAGGQGFRRHRIAFDFRDRGYLSYLEDGKRVLTRTTPTDSGTLRDIRKGDSFQRFWGDSLLQVADTTARKWSNSVNSVHYFAYLPYGLNDPAVNKEMLGTVRIGGRDYYKIKVTFDPQGGGEDYEDVFVYWFNRDTYNPDYLAYEFHTDGGGLRFREAYNPRQVGGLKFQDYINYKPVGKPPVYALDSLYSEGKLEELSRIELKNIEVSPDNYN